MNKETELMMAIKEAIIEAHEQTKIEMMAIKEAIIEAVNEFSNRSKENSEWVVTMVSNDVFKNEDTFDRIITEAHEQTKIDMIKTTNKENNNE